MIDDVNVGELVRVRSRDYSEEGETFVVLYVEDAQALLAEIDLTGGCRAQIADRLRSVSRQEVSQYLRLRLRMEMTTSP